MPLAERQCFCDGSKESCRDLPHLVRLEDLPENRDLVAFAGMRMLFFCPYAQLMIPVFIADHVVPKSPPPASVFQDMWRGD